MKRKIFFLAHSRLIFLFPISTGQRYGKVESNVCYYMEQAKHNPCWWLVVSGSAVVCNSVLFPRLDLMVKTSQFSLVLTLDTLELFHHFIVWILSLKNPKTKL